MKYPNNRMVVLDIAGQTAIIVCDNLTAETSLLALGFAPDNGRMFRKVADDSDRQLLVQSLIYLGALFSSGRDWSPAELVDFYHQQGIVTDNYQIIIWKGPDDYIVVYR